MRGLIFSFLLICSIQSSVAQNFVFTNGDTLSKVFEINDYSWAHTKIENLSEVNVIFKWEIITYNHPADWEFSMCDLPYCYTMGEMSGTMLPATGESIEAFLTLNIEAPSIDTGFYQIKVWDELFPENSDTLTITMISTPSFSAIEDDIQKPVPSYQYNDDVQKFTFKNPSDQQVKYEIYNVYGQLILSYQIEPESEKSIILDDWKSGNYILRYGANERSFYVGRIYILYNTPFLWEIQDVPELGVQL
ncbi:MAG: T9SS type A sorting domain-containing protein [Crocinitomix sp.]|nr:T9SS type A sorting domain-containing protein [Crocinitomix sp.]